MKNGKKRPADISANHSSIQASQRTTQPNGYFYMPLCTNALTLSHYVEYSAHPTRAGRHGPSEVRAQRRDSSFPILRPISFLLDPSTSWSSSQNQPTTRPLFVSILSIMFTWHSLSIKFFQSAEKRIQQHQYIAKSLPSDKQKILTLLMKTSAGHCLVSSPDVYLKIFP